MSDDSATHCASHGACSPKALARGYPYVRHTSRATFALDYTFVWTVMRLQLEITDPDEIHDQDAASTDRLYGPCLERRPHVSELLSRTRCIELRRFRREGSGPIA
jgi:hypothetical protein